LVVITSKGTPWSASDTGSWMVQLVFTSDKILRRYGANASLGNFEIVYHKFLTEYNFDDSTGSLTYPLHMYFRKSGKLVDFVAYCYSENDSKMYSGALESIPAGFRPWTQLDDSGLNTYTGENFGSMTLKTDGSYSIFVDRTANANRKIVFHTTYLVGG
jgi:hypothetical protein